MTWRHHLTHGRPLPLVEHLAVLAADSGDDMGQHARAAIGEWGIGARQLEQRHFGRAERDRGLRVELRADAKPLCRLRDPARS